VTPLLRRILVENRSVLLPIGIALLVNVLGFALVVYPRGIKAEGAADRADRAATALRAAEKEHADARALVSGKARADEELNAFYEKVLPASHEEAVGMTYASLPALARRSGVSYTRRSSEVEQTSQREDRLGHLTIRMVLQGDYEDFRSFIYSLESAPEFLIVDDVELTEAGPDEPLTFIVTMSTYFRMKSNGA
jgi:Tfp pilus assembly protein PilO